LPGVVKLLTTLSERGDVALGLLTGNVREGARRKLAFYDLWHWFPFGGFGDDHTDRCGIAAVALEAAKTHLNGSYSGNVAGGNNRPHGEVVVIGDTVHDITCGRSIGARCVAVATGHSSIAELSCGEPDVVLGTLEDSSAISDLFDR
jgi:phosphoglycolate phosphatase-like HAD superfamily hydrolase